MRKTHYEYFIQTYDKGNSLIPIFKKIYDCQLHNKEDLSIHQLIQKYITNDMFSRLTGCKTNEVGEMEQYYKRLLTSLYAFYYNKNVFDIGQNLITKLYYTDVNMINASFVKPPYNSMYINLPEDISYGSLPNGIKGLYLDYIAPENRMLCNNNLGNLLRSRECSYVNILAVSFGSAGTDYALKLPLVNNENIQEVLSKYASITSNMQFDKRLDYDIRMLVIKIILYINSLNNNLKEVIGIEIPAEYYRMKNNAKKRQLTKQYQNETKFNHYSLDVALVNHNNTISMNSDCYKLRTPHKVRGHFKHIHFGEKYCQVKTQWIQPYTRGNIYRLFNNERRYKVG